MKKHGIYIQIICSPFFMLLCSCGSANTVAMKENTNPVSDTIIIRVGVQPACVEVVDVNEDSFPDLIITDQADSNVFILLGSGSAQFQQSKNSPFYAGPLPNDITHGDFNRDGFIDLAFANHDQQYLTVLLGDGKGNFKPAQQSPVSVPSRPHTHGITTGDFNGDGWLDLATDSWGNNQVAVVFGDSAALFRTPASYFNVGKQPYQRLRAADLNNDALSDIVTTNAEGNNATILLGKADGTFAQPAGSPFACGDSPFGVAIGDINGDLHPDLAIINSPASMAGVPGKNGLTVLFGDGRGEFVKATDSPAEAGQIPNRVATGDIDGDGRSEVVTSDNETNYICLFAMDSVKQSMQGKKIKVGNHPKGVAIADLNNDGKGDIVVCNTGDGTISIILSR